MISAHLLLMFIAALIVVCALPGADMALVMQTSMSRGARRGFAAACGLGLARATHVTLSACGLAALLRNAPWLYEAVRYAGALYLTYIAVQIFRAPVFALPHEAGGTAARPMRADFLKGLLTNLLNPKALLFCSVLLPQFLRPEAGSVWLQVLELGVVLVIVCAIFDVIYALGAARIAVLLRKHPLAQTVQKWAFSSALIGFALRLSLD
ncbi:MAG: LysE family translocator [Paraburkholderia tropica]|uniref:Threonine/homoserine/homoserine lactone efflux protein n=1 Tax=Paraburkholderia tropica TaxID=92647 RepID=A0ABX5MDG0_9BURK|nr:LysE family translocator [Paraburkholderia tropica]MBB3004326.1 threonine/homoserine/homoserine lactone efflux protein [Paraburkholderia tropica]MBB6324101.1 threonine/homoserine/homoserine lactone efflux protein [Paraburkholderia tropica]MDE1139735.1 LysE family translocator [Paraburkholderia tropica]PXX04394.1 threonine/homoserine/homoserine lactone efflux protein [Paraburkholderia tropica]PZW70448.1 threonine/homoserine/homoserine lactone efflux protein [Paraburkholderia tropica]